MRFTHTCLWALLRERQLHCSSQSTPYSMGLHSLDLPLYVCASICYREMTRRSSRPRSWH